MFGQQELVGVFLVIDFLSFWVRGLRRIRLWIYKCLDVREREREIRDRGFAEVLRIQDIKPLSLELTAFRG